MVAVSSSSDQAPPPRAAPVLFASLSRPRQIWESVGGAVLMGAICGVLITVTWWAYLIGVVVSFAGGAPSGGQHRTFAGALTRGFVGGTTWALALLTVVAISGATPAVALPDPPIGFLPWGFGPACVVAAIAWLITRRRDRSLT